MKILKHSSLLLVAALSLTFAACTNDTPDKEAEVKRYALSEIATHNSATDCWLAIEGKVYDITEFIGSHPGGQEILRGCGLDATAFFTSRPGSGTPHSAVAEAKLDQFEIGVLATE